MPKSKKAEARALEASSPKAAEEVKQFSKNIEDAIEQNRPPQFTGIAVLGSHPETVNQAPFDDPSWLMYACSPHNLDIHSINGMVAEIDENGNERPRLQRYLNGGKRPDGGIYRVDEWFEVHMPSIGDKTRPHSYIEELKKLDRVWMRDTDAMPYYQNARAYPEGKMKSREMFGQYTFTSTIAYIMAKAIDDCVRMKIPNIGIFGVMQASETEYHNQRPGVQNMIHEATKAGLSVIIPEEATGLLTPPPEDF
jgi:hypothetical protein